MNKKEILDVIDRKIKLTLKDIEEYRELSKPEAPDVAIGRVSRMDAINNKSVMLSALRKAEEKLRALEKVKANIDNPEFGFCLKCNQPIPIQRILFRPESLLCVKCAE